MSGIPNDLKKLDRYFNGTTIFAFLNAPLPAGFPEIIDLYLNDD